MDEKIIKLAYALKQHLEEHPEVLGLNAIETKLSNDKAFLALHKTYVDVEQQLNNMYEMHYFTETQEKELKNAVFVAKKQVDEYPLVQAYYTQYKRVKKIYARVNKEIFDPLCKSEGGMCHIKFA